MEPRYKYPRTPHLPWSPGLSPEEVRFASPWERFGGREVVVTEKLDGENVTLYRDGLHARSLDGRHHPSRDWLKQHHASWAWRLPAGWRLCGESLYARHAIAYEDLASWLYIFSAWDARNVCLSWDATVERVADLGLVTPRVLWRGLWDEAALRALPLDTTRQEGYVVRLALEFAYADFGKSVAKWVRPGHVQPGAAHWMLGPVEVNGIKDS